jgi:hypothetical protein
LTIAHYRPYNLFHQVIVLDLYHTLEGTPETVNYLKSKGYRLVEGKTDPVVFVKEDHLKRLTSKQLALLGQTAPAPPS